MNKQYFLLLVLLLSVSHIRANNYPVTVRGYVFGMDGSGGSLHRFPLKGARVELMDSDADGSELFDDLMGTAIVNEDGSFEVTGSGGDPGDYSWSRPDVYIRFVYDYNGKVRLTDELDRTRYANTPEHDHDNFEGSMDIGTWTIGGDCSPGDATQCGVWYQVCRAWDNYIRLTGEEPASGYVDVEYWSAIYAGTPWTSNNTMHWPVHYDSRSALHEFGHIIRHSFDGDRDHFNWDVNRFRYARYHDPCATDCNNWSTESKEMNEGYAFNEGWAEFWAGEVYNCALSFSGECEGGVANILADIEDTLSLKFPKPRVLMLQALKRNPGAIHSLEEFVNKLNEVVGEQYVQLQAKRILRARETSTYFGRPMPKETQQAYMSRRSTELNSVITTIGSRITPVRRNPRTDRVVSIGGGKPAAESAVDTSSLRAMGNMASLQQEIIQKSQSEDFYEKFTRMKSDNSFEPYINNMQDYYNRRINDISLQAMKDALTRLMATGASDPYTQALKADIQNKMNRLQGGGRGGKKVQRGYSIYIGEAVTRS